MSKQCMLLVFCVAGFALCHGQENRKDPMASIEHAHRLRTHALKYLRTSNTDSTPFLKDSFLRNDDQDELRAKAEDALRAVSDGKYDVSSTCLNHTKIFLQALTEREPWAWRMIDAMGKPSSGLLDFQLVWLGSWEECRKVEATVNISSVISHPFKGQYCTTSFALGVNPTEVPFASPVLTITLGMCFPSSCSNKDAVGLAQTLESLLPINTTMLPPPFVNCQKEDIEYSNKAIAVLVVCAIFLAIVAAATAYDIIIVNWLSNSSDDKELPSKMKYGSFNGLAGNGHIGNGHVVDDRTPLMANGQHEIGIETQRDQSVSKVEVRHSLQQEPNYRPGKLGKILLSFSVYTNAPKIFGTSQPSGTLTAVNGIRFISMTWVILGHTYAFGLQTIDNIATYLPEVESRLTFQAISNATFAVDTFFVLRLLVSYLSLREMKKRGGMTKFKWGMFYFHRFWRLTPPYMLFLMTYVPLSKYFADGPLWPQATGFDIDECRDTWWTNLLYINNLVKSDKMCMGWSWYLANDMQFFILSPLMLIPLYYSPLWGTVSCMALVLVHSISTGVISRQNELGSNFLLGDTAAGFDKIYIKPWCRVGPYAVGFFTGYLLYKTDCKVKMPKVVNCIGWLIATTLALLILYGLYSPDNKEVMSVDVAALYNATSRTVWGACIAWVVFACATGYGGPVNKLLSWPAVIPFSRLTYCAYLVHPVIMFTYYFSHRTLTHWYDLEIVYIFFGNLCLSYAVAFVVSLVYESPMMGLEKVLLGREKNS